MPANVETAIEGESSYPIGCRHVQILRESPWCACRKPAWKARRLALESPGESNCAIVAGER